MSKTELPNFTIKQLLEAGFHFGHKTMRRNPKMSKYIHTNRNGISIIDLNKAANLLFKAVIAVKDIAKNNGKILFISTKKQGIDPVAEAAKRCGQFYVNFRWLGGMLTNWKTVSKSIKTLKKIEEQLADSETDYSKKEKLVLERKRLKLEQAIGGIKNMGGYPDLVVVIDVNKEALAIAEAKKLNIPIMALLDTNCNPDGISYPIPGNDDSAKSIKLFCKLLSDAAIGGLKENMIQAGVDVSKFETSEALANYKSTAVKNDKKAEDNKAKKSDKPKRFLKGGEDKSGKKSEEKPQTKKSFDKPVVKKATPELKKTEATKSDKKVSVKKTEEKNNN
jgi:small subunit ribosomal protein S2